MEGYFMINKLLVAVSVLSVFLFVGCSQKPKFSDSLDTVSPWNAFMGPKSKMVISEDKTSPAEGAASLKLDFQNADWAGIGRELADKPAWNKKYALTFKVKGDGTSHNLAVEITDNGGERFSKIVNISSKDWETITIPISYFLRRKDWQPDKAPDDGLTLTHVEGLSFSVGEKEKGFLSIDDIKLVKNK